METLLLMVFLSAARVLSLLAPWLALQPAHERLPPRSPRHVRVSCSGKNRSIAPACSLPECTLGLAGDTAASGTAQPSGRQDSVRWERPWGPEAEHSEVPAGQRPGELPGEHGTS